MSTPAPSTKAPEMVDYFAIFGLPRKLWIEMDGLEKKFLQLSWKLHPDNFVNATERERELSLEKSSQLNDATACSAIRLPASSISSASKARVKKASTSSRRRRSSSKKSSS